MTALELATLLSQTIYVVVFLLVGVRWLRARTPGNVDLIELGSCVEEHMGRERPN